jgi:hypothetical protein
MRLTTRTPRQRPPTTGRTDPSAASGPRLPAPHRLILAGAAAAVLLLATAVLAAPAAHADAGAAGAVQVMALAGSVTAVLDNIRTWIMGILAGLATVFLSIGGVRYLMASGDPGEVEKAKTAFKSAGFGYGLAALAPLVVQILKGIVGA